MCIFALPVVIFTLLFLGVCVWAYATAVSTYGWTFPYIIIFNVFVLIPLILLAIYLINKGMAEFIYTYKKNQLMEEKYSSLSIERLEKIKEADKCLRDKTGLFSDAYIAGSGTFAIDPSIYNKNVSFPEHTHETSFFSDVLEILGVFFIFRMLFGRKDK